MAFARLPLKSLPTAVGARSGPRRRAGPPRNPEPGTVGDLGGHAAGLRIDDRHPPHERARGVQPRLVRPAAARCASVLPNKEPTNIRRVGWWRRQRDCRGGTPVFVNRHTDRSSERPNRHQ